MRSVGLALTALVVVLVSSAHAADNLVERLATCQDSWLDFKTDPVATKKFAESFNAAFTQTGKDGSWTTKARTLVAGLPVVQAFPESVGMGVGFSVIVDASFDAARQRVEKLVGKTLKHCETSDGMHTCDLEIAAQRTLTLLTMVDQKNRTLVGCYYLYEK